MVCAIGAFTSTWRPWLKQTVGMSQQRSCPPFRPSKRQSLARAPIISEDSAQRSTPVMLNRTCRYDEAMASDDEIDAGLMLDARRSFACSPLVVGGRSSVSFRYASTATRIQRQCNG